MLAGLRARVLFTMLEFERAACTHFNSGESIAPVVTIPGSWAVAADAVVGDAELGRDMASSVAGNGVVAVSSSMIDYSSHF